MTFKVLISQLLSVFNGLRLISFCALRPGLDCWLNLTKVDPDEEVQGEIHLGLELLKDTEKISLRCQVIEAR